MEGGRGGGDGKAAAAAAATEKQRLSAHSGARSGWCRGRERSGVRLVENVQYLLISCAKQPCVSAPRGRCSNSCCSVVAAALAVVCAPPCSLRVAGQACMPGSQRPARASLPLRSASPCARCSTALCSPRVVPLLSLWRRRPAALRRLPIARCCYTLEAQQQPPNNAHKHTTTTGGGRIKSDDGDAHESKISGSAQFRPTSLHVLSVQEWSCEDERGAMRSKI